MKKSHLIILGALFVSAAFLGRQYQAQKNIPKAIPVAAPQVKSTFAEATQSAPSIEKVEATTLLTQSIERIGKGMPTVQQLRELGENELHHMPASIAEISEELGQIKQLIHDHPNDGHLIGKAIAFYRTCSTQTEWSTSVRALCLANLHEVAGESLDSAHVELYRLAKLAVELPES